MASQGAHRGTGDLALEELDATVTTDSQPAATYDCRDAFAEELSALAREDERIVAVCNDSVGSSNLVRSRRGSRTGSSTWASPSRTWSASAPAGQRGLIPFVCAAAPFLTGRAIEQIKADVAYSDRTVVLCGQSGHGVRRTRPDPPLDRGPVLAAGHRRPACGRARRSATDQRRRPLGRGRRTESYLRIPRFQVPDVRTRATL